MNRLCNQVQLLGKLGREIDFTAWDNGNSMARFSIATRETYKDNTGEKTDGGAIPQYSRMGKCGRANAGIFKERIFRDYSRKTPT